MKKILLFSFSFATVIGVCCCGAIIGGLVSTSFNEVAKRALPVLCSAVTDSSISVSDVDSFTYEDINYELYVILGDESNADTKGSDWGVNNIYNNFSMLDQSISELSSSCKNTLNKAVSSPFDFGLPAETYSCGSDNKMAWNITGTTTKVLLGYPVESDHLELFNMLGSYDTATGITSINVVSYNSYKPEDSPNYDGVNSGKFILRVEASGNTIDHSFTLRVIKRNIEIPSELTDGYNVDVVGQGISRGTGQYFLLKARDNRTNTTEKYFCFPAETTVAEVQAVTGTIFVNIDDHCAVYANAVQAMNFFNNTTEIPQISYTPTLSY